MYVDSGSTDGSVAYARSVGVDVVELDMAVPFYRRPRATLGVNASASSPPTSTRCRCSTATAS
ncbi:MAG: hypothetical protein R3B49_02965 [Phycisphaerales bacterium]